MKPLLSLLCAMLFVGCAASRSGFAPSGFVPPAFDVQGHRGARGLAPENTLPAFRRALELGVPTLELDTVVSGDGEVVVSHEPWFSAEICSLPSGAPVSEAEAEAHLILAMPYAEVTRYDCGRRGHPRFPRQEPQPATKPLLRDVIALAERYTRERGLPPVQYNVETKSRPEWDGVRTPEPGVFVQRLWEAVEAAGVAERFILQSFDVRTLKVARRRGLPVRLALLVASERPPLDALEAGLEALGFVPDVYSPDHALVTPEVLERARALGMQVIPWTVNDPDEMARLKAFGVDGLITDYPDLALPLVER